MGKRYLATRSMLQYMTTHPKFQNVSLTTQTICIACPHIQTICSHVANITNIFFRYTSLKLDRFPPQFIFYVRHQPLIWFITFREVCHGCCSFGVILGWPFSILAFLPVVIYSLVKRFKQAFISGAVTSIFLLGLSVLVDYYYYKRWTSSVLNLLIYNVLGGGESHRRSLRLNFELDG